MLCITLPSDDTGMFSFLSIMNAVPINICTMSLLDIYFYFSRIDITRSNEITRSNDNCIFNIL